MTTSLEISNDIFPDELMLKILLRLPVKTLKRFTCVCKSWFGTFQNPTFIRNHYLTNSVTSSNLYALVESCNDVGCSELRLLSNETMLVRETITVPYILGCGYWAMIDECQGLIYLYNVDDTSSVALLNPATTEFKQLPQASVKPTSGMEFTEYEGLGLGYDDKSNDYKVVRFVRTYKDDNLGQISQVDLYSLKSDSWKQIDFPSELNGKHFYETTFNTYVNGYYHWWLKEGHDILAFDMDQEVFQTMAFPANFDFGFCKTSSLELRVFDNYLAIFGTSRDVIDCFVVCVMEEYGVPESWTQRLLIGPIVGVRDLLAPRRGVDEWFFSNDLGELLLFDNSTEGVKNLRINCAHLGCPYSSPIVMFTENMLSLNENHET